MNDSDAGNNVRSCDDELRVDWPDYRVVWTAVTS